MSSRVELLIGIVIAFLPTVAVAKDEPATAQALLRGAERTRFAIDVASAELRVSYTVGRRQLETLLKVEQRPGPMRRVEVSRPSSSRIEIQNGDEIFKLKRTPKADLMVMDVERAVSLSGSCLFDLRLLGLSDLLHPKSTAQSCLSFDGPADIIGKEPTAEGTVWQFAVNKGRSKSTFWIEEPSFRVLRRMIEYPGGEIDIVCEYKPGPASAIPRHVVAVRRTAGEETRREWVVEHIDLAHSVPESRFAMGSMDIPLNTVVNDYRANRILGYWDGSGLSDRAVTPVSNRSPTPREYGWYIAVWASVVIALGAGLIWALKRSRTANGKA